MKIFCKNKSEGSTTNPNLQSQSQLHSNPQSTHPGSPSAPTASFPGPLGTYPGSRPGSSHKYPIFLSDHDSCSSSDSEPELTGADRVIRLLRQAKKPKQKPVYNFYEEVFLRQVADIRKQRDDIIKHLRSTPSPKKPNDLAQPSSPAPTNDEDEKNS